MRDKEEQRKFSTQKNLFQQKDIKQDQIIRVIDRDKTEIVTVNGQAISAITKVAMLRQLEEIETKTNVINELNQKKFDVFGQKIKEIVDKEKKDKKDRIQCQHDHYLGKKCKDHPDPKLSKKGHSKNKSSLSSKITQAQSQDLRGSIVNIDSKPE